MRAWAALALAAAGPWPFAHVYVANLARDTEHLAQMRRTLADVHIEGFEVFRAVDGMDPREVPTSRLAAMKRPSLREGVCVDSDPSSAPGGFFLRSGGRHRRLKKNEQACMMGCYLTHLNMLKDAQRHGYASVLLFEDDATELPDTLRGPQLLESLPVDWDMAYLGWRHAESGPRHEQAAGQALPPEDCVPLPAAPGLCRLEAPVLQQTHALAVHHKAYGPLIDALEHALAGGKACAVDQLYKSYAYRHPEFNVYAAVKPLFMQLSALGAIKSRIRMHIEAEP